MGTEIGDDHHSPGGADPESTFGRVETTDMGSDGEDSKVREAVRSAMGFLAGLASDYGISENSLLNAIQAARSSGVTDLRAARRAQKEDLRKGHVKALLDPRLSVE
jgi:hypothetical protein